jgi:uncharacterized membrane protein YfcA
MDSLTAIVALGAAIGGFVQGLSGFAFGLTALGVWAWSVDPALTGPLVIFGSLIGQILSIGSVGRGLDPRRILPFVAGGIAGVPVGVALLRDIDPLAFKLAVGVLLAVWCPAMLLARELPRITWGGRLADAAIGAIGGAMGGLAGLTGPAPTLWTALRGWDRDAQRAVFQAFNLAMQALTMTAYLAAGAVSAQAGRLFLVVVPTMLVPTLVGARLYRRFSGAAFQKIVLGLLTASGIVLIGTTAPHFLSR